MKEVVDEGIRQLVENAVARDDVAPLLRILFSITTAAASPEQAVADAATTGTNAWAQQGPAITGPTAADGKNTLATIAKSLQSLAAEQDQVIKDICNTHAMEIAGFVTDLHNIQEGAASIQDLMTQANDIIQGGGGTLLEHARTLSELSTVQENVVGGLAGVRGAQKLLQSCLQVGQLLEDRQLYQALRLIQDIQGNQLASLLTMLTVGPMPSSASRPAASTRTASQSGAAPGPDAGRQLANVVSLRAFFESLVGELVAAVEALAISELHAWLVSARSAARTIGLRAVRRAAIQRQLEEDLARERLRLGAQLTLADSVLPELCASVVSAPFRQELQSYTAWPPSTGTRGEPQQHAATGAAVISLQGVLEPAELQALSPGQPATAVAELVEKWNKQQRRRVNRHNAAVRVLAGTTGAAVGGEGPGCLDALGSKLCSVTDNTVPLLAGLPMKELFRCTHIHEVLGRTQRLRDYYVEQRRLQMAADLAAPHVPFLENYQNYLGQVVGFFVVESAVARLQPQLVHAATAELLWEGAAAQIKSVLERVLCSPGAPGLLAAPRTSSITMTKPNSPASKTHSAPGVVDPAAGSTPAIMVLVKDFVMLACDALEEAGCTPWVIEDVLLTASVRYYELLTADATADAQQAVNGDTLSQEVTATTKSVAEHLFITLGLPAQLDAAPALTPAGASDGDTRAAPSRPPAAALPALPHTAPFTPLVPALVKLVRSYVQDSASYLRNLIPPWELEDALTQFRDKMVSKVVVEALNSRINALASSGHMAESMRLVTDAWAMVQALPSLEAHLTSVAAPLAEQDPQVQVWMRKAEAVAAQASVQAVCDTAPTGRDQDPPSLAAQRKQRTARNSDMGSSILSGAPAPALSVSLHQIQDHAERAVLRQVAAKLDAMLSAGFKATPWTPTTLLPPGPSDHVLPLIAYLQECFDAARRALPRPSFAFLMRTVFKSLAISYMKLFSPDGAPGYNLLVIERLAYDISALQNFAARAAAKDTVSDNPALANMHSQFAEPEQLFRLLLSNQLEDVLVPELRRQRYPNLDASTIVLALDKYKELLKVSGQKTEFPTRKQVDSIAKALRGQMVVGSANTVLQGF